MAARHGVSNPVDAVTEGWLADDTSGSAPHPFGGEFDQFTHDVHELMFTLAALLLSKHRDYGPKNIGGAPGGPLNGLRVRLWDKLARINNLVDANIAHNPCHESLRDSFADLANYGIIGCLVLDGRWPE